MQAAIFIPIVIIIIVVNIIRAAAKSQGNSGNTGSGSNQQYYRTNNNSTNTQQGYKPYTSAPAARPANTSSVYATRSGAPNYGANSNAGTYTNQSRHQNYQTTMPQSRRPAPRPSATDAHLCDPGGHSMENDRDYVATLNEMEAGYRAYIPPRGAIRSTRNQLMRMTVEEIRKKEEGLKDLRNAGIISHEEYAATIRSLH